MRPEFDGFGAITPHSDGSFSFAEPGDGMPALLLPVFDLRGEHIETIAWRWGRAASPWWLWRKSISYLGELEIERDRLCSPRRPIRFVATPADWLADAGHAICIVDWAAPIGPLLDELGEIVCSTSALERRLRAAVAAEAARKIRGRAA